MEDAGTSECYGVLVACASIHGNTKAAAEKMVEVLRANGASKVVFMDLTRDDMAEAVADAFRYGKIILAAASYDAGVFPPMEDFLHRLVHKNLQKRTFGLIENGSWAPCAAKGMKGILEGMKEVNVCENVVSIKSTMKDTDVAKMEELAKEILA
jgi:flavorubredoxin